MHRFLLLLASILTFSFAEPMAYQDDIDIDDAVDMIDEGAVVIDVRSPGEFIHTGHGLGHINIPVFYESYTTKSLKTRMKFAQMETKNGKGYNSRKLFDNSITENKKFVKEVMSVVNSDIERDIILLCHSGQRSAFAANILAKKGFDNVYNLDGGFLSWRDADQPWSVD
jgi:rhodanese-related sulfurtransferase